MRGQVEGEIVMVFDKIRLTSSKLYNAKIACCTENPIASRAQVMSLTQVPLGSHPCIRQRESSLLTTYWSESTLSS